MSDLSAEYSAIWPLVMEAGLGSVFDERGAALVECPACGGSKSLRLTLHNSRAGCQSCGVEAPLESYFQELIERNGPAAVMDITAGTDTDYAPPALPSGQPAAGMAGDRPAYLPGNRDPRNIDAPASPAVRHHAILQREADSRITGETIIISALSLVFLMAGLAAALLSGFANYQAFAGMVNDPIQGRVWGWAGVVASICSFGGFTFFWWHASARRWSESVRTIIFALAGATTSIVGTALFMHGQDNARAVQVQLVLSERAILEAQITDWSEQMRGIPAGTRSVAGLETYLAEVERVGRTADKPYRDAQNELGLARRRAGLETQIAEARAYLLDMTRSGQAVSSRPSYAPPGWLFALMLEIFSSQATSIACVSLLLLYGVGQRFSREEQPVPGS